MCSSKAIRVLLQTTHLVVFKLPRAVQQIHILRRKLGPEKQITQWEHEAAPKRYVHLLIDLRPSHLLRYCLSLNLFLPETIVLNVHAPISGIMLKINAQIF